MSGFPITRLRRLRRTPALRRLAAEARLDAAQLIWPLFIKSGGAAVPIPAMPGVYQHPLSDCGELAGRAADLGLGGVLLFGIPDRKDAGGTEAFSESGVVQQAVRAMKDARPELLVVTDVCLCEYTSHGHCGVLAGETVDNDATLPLLGRIAVSHAEAGADIVAPSDMMDGRVGALRSALDESGMTEIPILSYAAKYASSFYGPFRDAAGSAPQVGDRRGYQMDPANADEAMREIEQDLAEGADLIMVKPGLPCLDVVRRAKDRFGGPIAVYQVSGEYSMIKFAARAGALDGDAAMREALLSIRRAGGDIIVSYAAPEMAHREEGV